MTRAEKNAVRTLLQTFVQDTTPEYIRDSGQYILSDGGVQKINITQDGDAWSIEGSIQGDDFQVYTPALQLNLADRNIKNNCNCSESFTGVCRHVAAVALQ